MTDKPKNNLVAGRRAHNNDSIVRCHDNKNKASKHAPLDKSFSQTNVFWFLLPLCVFFLGQNYTISSDCR